MVTRTLAAVAREVNGELIGKDASFDVVAIDTRSLSSGALFVAIRGDHFDGNDFVAHAHSLGAAGALVSNPAAVALPQVRVNDTRKAFGQMAHAWRSNFSLPVVAVTGSNGKTTVKELIASILRVRGQFCVTQGNLNNDIGVPLTLMRLNEEDQVLVVELGANRAGEIAYLSELTCPTVGIITNADSTHLEGFGSLRGVAAAKGELMDCLPPTGVAVLNADDRYCDDWRRRSRAKTIVTFGFSGEADCCVSGETNFGSSSSRFTLRLPRGELLEINLPLPGRHNVLNALAAAAVTFALGTSSTDIAQGLGEARAVDGRLNILRGRRGSTIVDDSYNANPASARAALEYLAGKEGRRVLVLGDMAELGPGAGQLHSEVGEYAKDRCDTLIAIGRFSRFAAEAFGDGAHMCADIDAAKDWLARLLASDVTVLVKGSRAMGLEALVGHLIEENSKIEVGP
ncbi:MAG: UDP-N-acetylmuramoyl-tripeptide--D-alanyl-D-alanine ligase [Gammaproteobacteria bacterium]